MPSGNDATAPGDDGHLRIPFIRDGQGLPLTIPLPQPQWHTAVFFVGLASLVRTMVAETAWTSPITVSAAYGVAIVAAFLASKWVDKVPARPRVISSSVGLTGFALAVVTSGVPATVQLVSLAAASTVLLVTISGEVLYQRDRRRRSGGAPSTTT